MPLLSFFTDNLNASHVHLKLWGRTPGTYKMSIYGTPRQVYEKTKMSFGILLKNGFHL